MKMVRAYYTLFYKQHFYKQLQAKIGKNLIKTKHHREAELLSRGKQNMQMKSKKKKSVCFNHYIETSQLICRANQLTGFYMMEHWPLKG